MAASLDPWLHATGAWAIFVVNFRSNFSGYAYTYCLPLITARDYGFGQLSNSYVFGVIAGVRIGVTLLVSRLAKRYSDRGLMLSLVSCSLALTLGYCACSRLSTERVPLAALVALFVGLFCSDSGPPTQGLYSKLIGRGHAGLYFAVLQSNGAIARALAGQLVGLAYGRLGPAALWGTMIALAAGMPRCSPACGRARARPRRATRAAAAARAGAAAAASVNGDAGVEGDGRATEGRRCERRGARSVAAPGRGFGFDDAGPPSYGPTGGRRRGREGAPRKRALARTPPRRVLRCVPHFLVRTPRLIGRFRGAPPGSSRLLELVIARRRPEGATSGGGPVLFAAAIARTAIRAVSLARAELRPRRARPHRRRRRRRPRRRPRAALRRGPAGRTARRRSDRSRAPDRPSRRRGDRLARGAGRRGAVGERERPPPGARARARPRAARESAASRARCSARARSSSRC